MSLWWCDGCKQIRAFEIGMACHRCGFRLIYATVEHSAGMWKDLAKKEAPPADVQLEPTPRVADAEDTTG